MESIQTGDLVLASYKTGEYIAEVVEKTPPRAVIKILAVHKHPAQGDLHHPYEPDVPFFHQRRALAYQEKAVVMLQHLQPYHGEVPEYRASLLEATEREIQALDKLKRWAERALVEYEQLQDDYLRAR